MKKNDWRKSLDESMKNVFENRFKRKQIEKEYRLAKDRDEMSFPNERGLSKTK